jgi:DNA-binding CsgD family transcriptional regulator
LESLVQLDEYLARVSDCADFNQLSRALIDGFSDLGAGAISGQSMAKCDPLGEESWTRILSTFPEQVGRAYWREQNINDPVRNTAMSTGAPIHFIDIAPTLNWDPPMQQVYDAFTASGFRDAVATPVFAGPGAPGFFMCAFAEERPDLTRADMRRIQIMFSEFYVRWRQVSQTDRVALSRREHEVLLAIVRNQSSADIGVALGVSEHTVNTYIRRCYDKLNASSRIEAALKYVGMGLGPERARASPRD